MKKIYTTLLTAILLASLTGCNTNGESSDTPNSSGGSSAITDSSDNPDNSDNSDSSGSSTAPDSAPEPPKPAGEPTFLTCPDGTPIYTSEISEVYTGEERFENKKTITLAEAEQIAQTGDGYFTIKCDGFVYGYIRQRAVNRIENPDMFIEDEHGSFDYLGELSDKISSSNKRLTDFIRIKPGDKFGELTVKNAYMLFTGNTKYANTPYIPGAHISDGCIEFDGAIELEGYINVTPTDTLYGEGGDMTFVPNGDSSTKLPCVLPFWDEEEQKYYDVTRPRYYGYFGGLELELGNMYKVESDTSGLQPGDSMVKAKISLENIRYVPGFMGGWKFDLKSIEVL